MIKVKRSDGEVFEVTQKAYDVIYQYRGFTIVDEKAEEKPKTQRKRKSTPKENE